MERIDEITGQRAPAGHAGRPVDPDFLEAVIDQSSDLIVVVDAEATLRYVSGAATRILELRPSEWIGRSVLQLLHPDDVDAAVESLGGTVAEGSGVKDPLALRVRHRDGTWRSVEIIANNLLDDPAVGGIVINARNVEERLDAERRALSAQRRFEKAFQHSPVGMALTDMDGRFVRVNDALCSLLGRTASELLRTGPLDVTHPDDVDATRRSAVSLLEGTEESSTLEKRFLAGSGAPVWTRANVSLLRDEEDGAVYFLSHVEDIGEHRRLMDSLRRSALCDPLTGVANRAGLEQFISTLAPEDPVGVIAVDLDRFKAINDTWGHLAGDQVLSEVAGRLRSCIRAADCVARVGGDEFVVVACGSEPSASTRRIVERLDESMREPVHVDGAELVVGMSVGSSHGVAGEATRLLRDADVESYRTKRGRQRRVATIAK